MASLLLEPILFLMGTSSMIRRPLPERPYGHQFPERGASVPSEFSGGEETVRPTLEKLGFSFNVASNTDDDSQTSISASDLELLRQSRMRNRYAELTSAEKEAYRRIHRALERLGNLVISRLEPPEQFALKLTSGFHVNSGVRGALPKDLWFAVYNIQNLEPFVGMPQLFMIASERGIEAGYAAAIHPDDFSNATIKQRVRDVAPHVFSILAAVPDELVAKLDADLQQMEHWFFRRKTRLAPNVAEFPTLGDWIAFLNSPEGRAWAGGAISRYLIASDLKNGDMNLEALVKKIADIFRPLMLSVTPPGGLRTLRPVSDRQNWIFQANPERFDIDGALGNLLSLTWTAGREASSIGIGDRVFLWRSGATGGIVAVATITEAAATIPASEQELPYVRDKELLAEPQPRVHLRIDQRLTRALSRASIASDPRLRDLTILRFAQQSVYRITAEQAEALLDMVEEPEADLTEADAAPLQRTWIYAPGRDAEYWDELYELSIMAIGWDDLGDLSKYDTLESFESALASQRATEQRPTNDARACYDFVHAVRPGDLIFVKRGRSTIIGSGVVTGEYQHDQRRTHFRNTRPMRWEARGEWPYPGRLPIKTLTDWTGYPEAIKDLKRIARLSVSEPPKVLPLEERPLYSIDQAVDGLFMSRREFEHALLIWRAKKNLILKGAPGVGKTFIAKRLSYALMGYQDPSRIRSVQFHQSYFYEDFVQGFRPSGDGFVLKPGIFLEFCERALAEPSETYIFLIDEINRGNLSKILGELMLLIEADKRSPDWATKLAYAESAEERFYIPPNVYIIGMMNTADRSLSMVDYALRRRFAFVTLKPEFASEAFSKHLIDRGASDPLIEKIVSRMSLLNAAIAEDTVNLGRGFCIGHSFFSSIPNQLSPSENWYKNVIETEITPLLEEYWFDKEEQAAEWRARLLE
jgi:MoxR-like ATPase